MVNWNEVRKNFPVTEKYVYLDSACFSVTFSAAVREIEQFVERMLYFEEHSWADRKKDETREEAAKLMHASRNEVGLGEGATYGLNVFARTVSDQLREGDNVVTADMEFLQSTLPWLALSKKKGIELRLVKNTDGTYKTADFERLIDERTKVISVSSVQWNNGFKLDVEEIGEIAEKKNIYFVVDAAHHLGAAELDVHKAKIDFMSSSGHKWLVSPFGTGLFYMSNKLLDTLEPDLYGYMNVKPPRNLNRMGEYFEVPDANPAEEFKFVEQEARKFETGGTSNYPGAIGLAASLRLFNEIGMDNIAERILDLGDYLIEELQKIGPRIVSPLDRAHRAGITTFRMYEDPIEDKKLQLWLKSQGIFVSIRYTSSIGGIRVSTHLYNNEEDVDKLIDAIRMYNKSH
ncbi:MAG: aminotransferase class V-fold PLP-dependent enzyme [Nitrososphaerota archaeon]|nr:aminotransferase class V-fold PLP-dependent enzyme [Nitrososphaerota archaeon]